MPGSRAGLHDGSGDVQRACEVGDTCNDDAVMLGTASGAMSAAMADAAGGMVAFDLEVMAHGDQSGLPDCPVPRVSDTYRRLHAIVPQTAPSSMLCQPTQHTLGHRRFHDDDNDCGAGMGFWTPDSPVHVARGTLRRLLAPESIPESMPSVESYHSSFPASQDGANQWEVAVGAPQSWGHARMATPSSDTSNDGSARDAHVRALGTASPGMRKSSPYSSMHSSLMPKAQSVAQEYPDAATPLLTAKELSRRRQEMSSTNRRKRRSSDAHTAPSTRSAELARSAALMVAAPGSSIRVESTSGTIEDSLMGSVSGSARLSSRSEPQTSSHKCNSSLGSSRVSSSGRTTLRHKGLRPRLSGSHRTTRQRSMTSEASSDCSPRRLHPGTAAALVPPMTAVDGPLTLLPTCPVAQHHGPAIPSHADQHAHMLENRSEPSTAHVAPQTPPFVPTPPWEYTFVMSNDPRPHTFSYTGTPDTDSAQCTGDAQQQPSPDTAQAGEWAAGELAGLNLGATAAPQNPFQLHLPITPRGSPRSPSPQRICRRLETTPIAQTTAPHSAAGTQPPTTPRDGGRPPTPRAQMEPGFQSVYSGQACARSRMAGAVAGSHPKETEESDAKKMQFAMQRFERELRGRLVVHGVEESRPVGNDIVPEHRLQMMSVHRLAGPRPVYMQEHRLSERQFDDKDRLEEGTLSALAACMHRRIT